MRRTGFVWAILLAAGLIAGCADLPARLRRHTYPPNFKYIGRTELRSTMWQLASDVSQLDDLMRQPGPVEETRRAQIAQLLAAMDDSARALATNGRPTNHPLMADSLDNFRRALDTARASVASERPNYYLVGSVSGACLVCHGPDR
jgi:outer membrane murein-binding lipoprotein Lpp